MANNKKPASITSTCTVCIQEFPNVQECLKHELIVHSLQKRYHPDSSLKKRINATTKFLNTVDKLEERARVNEFLKKSKNGDELKIIFELLCIKTDYLDFIFKQVQTCLEGALKSVGAVRTYLFGSAANGLALRDCDFDIYLDPSSIQFTPKHQNYRKQNSPQRSALFNRITKLLYRSPSFTDVFAIRTARVPIIRCKHRDTGFQIDINLSSPSSKENTFLYKLIKSDKRIYELMLFLKLWAKNVQIVGRNNMTSYCLTTMITFFLQQPWKMDDGEDNTSCCILKSIKELQQNCNPNLVEGVNYAFDLSSINNRPNIPTNVKSWDLIKAFFKFYRNYNFDDLIMMPYYGKSVKRGDFTPEMCEEYYNQFRNYKLYSEEDQPVHLQINRSVCIQDAFSLNQNIAKSILPQLKQYLIFCLENAYQICENTNKFQMAEIYEQLLYDTIKVAATKFAKREIITHLKNIELPVVSQTSTGSRVMYTLTPTKADLRILASKDSKLQDKEAVLRCWCQHFVDAIEIILVKIYRMDVHEQSPPRLKQQKLEHENMLNKCWLISGTIDLWTNRSFEKSARVSFMEHQLKQTEHLHNLRRQDPNYSVTLNALLKLHIKPDYAGIDIEIDLPDDTPTANIFKRSPLRRFFNMLKNTLQNYKLRDNNKTINHFPATKNST